MVGKRHFGGSIRFLYCGSSHRFSLNSLAFRKNKKFCNHSCDLTCRFTYTDRNNVFTYFQCRAAVICLIILL